MLPSQIFSKRMVISSLNPLLTSTRGETGPKTRGTCSEISNGTGRQGGGKAVVVGGIAESRGRRSLSLFLSPSIYLSIYLSLSLALV